MKLCRLILEDVNFEVDSMQFCCSTGQLQGTRPALPYLGGKIDRASYHKYIYDLIDSLQDEKSDVCKGCTYIKDINLSKPITENDLLRKQVSINHYRYLCNSKCIYCNYWHKTEQPNYFVLDGIRSLFSGGMLARDASFSWGGGEPTMLKEFEITSSWLNDKNFKQKIHTNAIATSKAIVAALEKGNCNVDISLDAGTEETHALVKGVKSWKKVLRTCKTYAEHAVRADSISLKYIVLEENNTKDEVDAFLEICDSMNLKNIEFSLNFSEVGKNTVSPKTIEAARYLCQQSAANGFTCTAFFVHEPYLSQIIKNA